METRVELILTSANQYDKAKLISSTTTGFAFHVNTDEHINGFREVHEPSTKLKQIRVWSKEELRAEDFNGFTQLSIQGKEVSLGDAVLNLGDEYKIENNTYPIRTVVQSLSCKNKNIPLKNSLTIYLNLQLHIKGQSVFILTQVISGSLYRTYH